MVSENALPLGKNSLSILKEHAQTFTISVCFITFAKTLSGQRAEPQMQRSGFENCPSHCVVSWWQDTKLSPCPSPPRIVDSLVGERLSIKYPCLGGFVGLRVFQLNIYKVLTEVKKPGNNQDKSGDLRFYSCQSFQICNVQSSGSACAV